MTLSIDKMPRPVRRRLKQVVRKSKDSNYSRRANAMLLLGGHTDAVAAINQLLPDNPIEVIDPRKLIELITTHSTEWNDWATVMRKKYKL